MLFCFTCFIVVVVLVVTVVYSNFHILPSFDVLHFVCSLQIHNICYCCCCHRCCCYFFLFSLTNSFTQKSTKHKTNKFCGFFSNSEIVVRYYYKITKRQTTLFFFSFSHSHTEHHFWCLFWSAIKKKYKVNNHRLSLPISNTKKKTMCKKLKTNTITQIQKHWKCHMMLKKLTDDHTDSDFHLADHNYPNKLKKKVQ